MLLYLLLDKRKREESHSGAPCPFIRQLPRADDAAASAACWAVTRLRVTKPQTPTWSKVHGGIQPLQRPALHKFLVRAVGGEQDHVITQVVVETLLQETQVVIVTAEVAAILIFNLQVKRKEGKKKKSEIPT